LSEANITRAAPPSEPPSQRIDRNAAAVGGVISFGALFSATACCVLPLILGAIGLGTGGLAVVVSFHWPLTIAAVIAVAAGWLFYFRRRRACAGNGGCSVSRPTRATFITLCVATSVVTVSALWDFIETPLMRLLGGS
jgi:hypothetical protein